MRFALLFALEVNGENRKIAVLCDSIQAIESDYEQVRYPGLPKGVYSVGVYLGRVYPVYRLKTLNTLNNSKKSWYFFSISTVDTVSETLCIESQIYPKLIDLEASQYKEVERMSLNDFFEFLAVGNKCTSLPKAA
jgi:hypothetical protein